jgi:preprotein translocase subunit SecA
MKLIKIPDEEPIESKMISGLIEKAQNKVEGLHFDSRKYVLEYDEVLSKQRNKIYQKRDEVLKRNRQELKDDFFLILSEELKNLASFFWQNQNLSELNEEIKTIFPSTFSFEENILKAKTEEEIILMIVEEARRNLSAKEEKEGEEALDKILRFVFLKTIDMFGTEHLVDMNFLQDSARLKAFAGRDPLVEYKISGAEMFQRMEKMIDKQIIRTVFKLSAN